MGFLGLFGRGNARIREDIDAPPIPPPPAAIGGELNEEIGAGEELPPLPDLSEEFGGGGLQEQRRAEKAEDYSSILSEENVPIAPVTKPAKESYIPGKGLHKQAEPIFVGVDSFRNDVIKNVIAIKNELKESNTVLLRLSKLEQTEAILFREWHSKMEELQKRLIFVDKALFKG